MRVYSFNDFKYICYVEDKQKAIEKLFSDVLTNEEIRKLQSNIEKEKMELKCIYNNYSECFAAMNK